MFRFVLQAHRAKGPFHVIELVKARSLRKEIFCANQARQAGIAALQEGHHGFDGLQVRFAQGIDPPTIGGLDAALVKGRVKYLLQVLRRKKRQDYLYAEVHLKRGNALCVEKPLQVRRRRIGRI